MGWPTQKNQALSVSEDVGNWDPHALLMGMKTGQPLWRTVWGFLKKLNIQLPCSSTIPLLDGIKRIKSQTYTDIRTPMSTAALFQVAKR